MSIYLQKQLKIYPVTFPSINDTTLIQNHKRAIAEILCVLLPVCVSVPLHPIPL